MPYENHFIVLFQSEYTDDNLQSGKWYLYDDLEDLIFEIILIQFKKN
jgi:hypothetical protein